jgi:hypothetical protein
MRYLKGADDVFVDHNEGGKSGSRSNSHRSDSMKRACGIAMYVAAAALVVVMCSCERCADDVSEGVQKQIKKVLVVKPQDFIK